MIKGLLVLLVLITARGLEAEARFFDSETLVTEYEESPWVEYIENEPDCDW